METRRDEKSEEGEGNVLCKRVVHFELLSTIKAIEEEGVRKTGKGSYSRQYPGKISTLRGNGRIK